LVLKPVCTHVPARPLGYLANLLDLIVNKQLRANLRKRKQVGAAASGGKSALVLFTESGLIISLPIALGPCYDSRDPGVEPHANRAEVAVGRIDLKGKEERNKKI
jgi:hypothetical protein